MARQIQIRRGTAIENDAFTGAPGEVTMDETNKTLRVHDGATCGGTILARRNEIPSVPNDIMAADYVVEWQSPTAENNYTWYRKYKSGWIEQGGKTLSTNVTTVILPVTMTTDYTVLITPCDVGTTANYRVSVGNKNSTSVDIVSTVNISKYWYISGK